MPVPYVDHDAAERLFRAKVLALLTGEGLLSDERARVLMSWRHNSGFSVDDSVRFEPEDTKAMEKVARYLLRPPLSLERMTYSKGDDQVVYRRKAKDGRPGEEERIDALDFLARVIAHIPPPRVHLIRYFAPLQQRLAWPTAKGQGGVADAGAHEGSEDDGLTDAQRRARRREWARLIRRVYEVDPLVCPKCGGEMKIISVILEHKVIRRSSGISPAKALRRGGTRRKVHVPHNLSNRVEEP